MNAKEHIDKMKHLNDLLKNGGDEVTLETIRLQLETDKTRQLTRIADSLEKLESVIDPSSGQGNAIAINNYDT